MRYLLSLVFLFLFSPQVYAVSQTQIEAVFLEKFTHLIEWPEDSKQKDFTICILENQEFAEALKRIYKNKKFNTKDVNIVPLSRNENIPQCQLLFIGKNVQDINNTLKSIAGKPMLTVSDNREHVDNDVMITMFLLNNRFKYIINNKAAQKADIKISYLLLKSAQEVIK